MRFAEPIRDEHRGIKRRVDHEIFVMGFYACQFETRFDDWHPLVKPKRKYGPLSRVLVRSGIVEPERLASVIYFYDDAAEKIGAQRSLIGPPNLLRKIGFIDLGQINEGHVDAGEIQNRILKIAQSEIGSSGRADRRRSGRGIEHEQRRLALVYIRRNKNKILEEFGRDLGGIAAEGEARGRWRLLS